MSADQTREQPKMVRIRKELWMVEDARAELEDGHEATPKRVELAYGSEDEIECIDLT